MPKEDANDFAARHGADALRTEAEARAHEVILEELSKFTTAFALKDKHRGRQRDIIMHGFARVGEVINIVAPSKMGKTWLTYNIALSIASGQPFLLPEWTCCEGNIVIIDNELHEETISYRLPRVCEAMNLHEDYLQRIIPITLRGKGFNINDLAPLMTDIKQFAPKLVIFDSLYRFMPKGCSENDNVAMTGIYNTLDRYAEIVGTAAFIVILHTSKGNQGEKEVMDAGAGAGAMGRATDNHIVIREHETEGLYVIQSKPRSFPPQDPIVIRQAFPIYIHEPLEDATKLKGKKPAKAIKKEPAKSDSEDFINLLNNDWKSQRSLLDEIARTITSTDSAAKTFLSHIIDKFRLNEIHHSDAPKNCGMFECQKRGTLMFRLKQKESNE